MPLVRQVVLLDSEDAAALKTAAAERSIQPGTLARMLLREALTEYRQRAQTRPAKEPER